MPEPCPPRPPPSGANSRQYPQRGWRQGVWWSRPWLGLASLFEGRVALTLPQLAQRDMRLTGLARGFEASKQGARLTRSTIILGGLPIRRLAAVVELGA